MTIGRILSGVQGLAYGLTFTEARRLENSVRAGENLCMTALFQLTQSAKVIQCASMAMQAAGRSGVAWPLQAITLLTPPLLAITRKFNLVPENIRPAINFMQNHIGTLYEVAAVVSSVVLLYFGHVFFAATSLAVLALGIMDRKGWLPTEVRQFLHQYCQPTLMVTGLVCGSFIDRLFALFNLASWGAQWYLSQQSRERPVEALPQNSLTHQTIQDFLHGREHFTVNRAHLFCNASPPIPEIDIEILLQQFDQMDWSSHMRVLREKCRQDARFTERHRNPALKTDQEIIAIVKGTLTSFIRSVKEHRILEGEPLDYQRLHNYLKAITKYIQDQPNEITKADALMVLAVEGGEYCGPGKFETTENLYAQMISDGSTLSLPDKVLHCLQDERNRWMQHFYNISTQSSPVLRAMDRQDIHIYNLIVNCYGDRFGLRKAAAENDETALVEPLLKAVVTLIIGKTVERMFWADHRQANLVDTLSPSIGTAQLPKPEIYAFWQAWIERQEIADAMKEQLRDELGNGMLYNRPLEINGRIDPRFIALMLFDMGILERATEEASESGSTNDRGLLDRSRDLTWVSV